MATYRDAVRRLQIIYNECAPQAKDRREADRTMDDFTRMKKQIHLDVKAVRQVHHGATLLFLHYFIHF